MEREPGDFERRDDARGGDAGGDDVDHIIGGRPDSREEIDAAIAEAEADMTAGRVVPHQLVSVWLETWGTPDFKPMPDEWLK